MPPQKKIILIGDEGCGKTGLIFSFFTDNIPDPAVPTIYKEYSSEVEVDGNKVPVVLWIIPVQEHYSQIRPLSYDDTDAVILCFAISDPASLTNAAEKWLPEIREHLPEVPVVLVGNKIDLRSDEKVLNELASKSLKPISYDQGKDLAEKINARQYVECSAKNSDNVQEVFKAAAAATLLSA